MIPCEFSETFKNNFFIEHLQATASGNGSRERYHTLTLNKLIHKNLEKRKFFQILTFTMLSLFNILVCKAKQKEITS